MIEFQHIAAAVYLAAGVGGLLAVVLPSERMARGSVWGLAIGAALQTLAFATLHRIDPVPQLTSLSLALSVAAWLGVVFLLLFMVRLRLPGLAAGVGPIAFFCVFVSSLYMPESAQPIVESGSIPHAHILLSAAGLALMAIAGLSGLFFLVEHRSLKSKRGLGVGRFRLPSLEALDRVNVVALAIGFPLLTLGMLTGALWLQHIKGTFWLGTHHETWTSIAWLIYGGLVLARFVGHQGSRQAAASAVAGFAFLLFAVVGVELFA